MKAFLSTLIALSLMNPLVGTASDGTFSTGQRTSVLRQEMAWSAAEALTPLLTAARWIPDVRQPKAKGRLMAFGAIAGMAFALANYAQMARGNSALALSFDRNLLATIPLVAIVIWTGWRSSPIPTTVQIPVPMRSTKRVLSTILAVVTYAVIFQGISTPLLVLSYQGMSANIAMVINNATPPLVFLLGLFWFGRQTDALRESASPQRWMGFAFGIVSVAIAVSLVLRDPHNRFSAPALGFALSSMATWAFAQVSMKVLSTQLDRLRLSLATFVISLAPLALFKSILDPQAPWFLFERVGLMPLFGIASLQAVANVLILQSSRLIDDAAEHALWMSFTPFLIMLFRSLLGYEPWQSTLLVPMALNAIALLLIIRNGSRQETVLDPAANPVNEMLNIYDMNNLMIGVERFLKVHVRGHWHRAVQIVPFDPETGEIVLQVRSQQVRGPGLLDVNGGHVKAGASDLTTAVEENKEEMFYIPASRFIRAVKEHFQVTLFGRFINREFRAVYWVPLTRSEVKRLRSGQVNTPEVDRFVFMYPEDALRKNQETPELFADGFGATWGNPEYARTLLLSLSKVLHGYQQRTAALLHRWESFGYAMFVGSFVGAVLWNVWVQNDLKIFSGYVQWMPRILRHAGADFFSAFFMSAAMNSYLRRNNRFSAPARSTLWRPALVTGILATVLEIGIKHDMDDYFAELAGVLLYLGTFARQYILNHKLYQFCSSVLRIQTFVEHTYQKPMAAAA